ncbi:MAG: type II toxin-antitoxin system Phd/YefM family antitoxin [Deltaproteobacteria bacterium]|nr:type II toxin-antitoxin system Phd/YefM family antitoxin [Deltaproteobacteria bacterium]MBW1819937.1 type II toxin-antitoxin system Phd/YefM family antitoxin [Deltaproteobacteria bacterium]
MITLSLSEAKINLSKLIEKITSTDEEILITKNGKPAAVLVSPDEFEGWKETVSIQSDPAFMKEIRKGLRGIEEESGLYTLEELFDPSVE